MKRLARKLAAICGAMLLGAVTAYICQLVTNPEDLLVMGLAGVALIWRSKGEWLTR